MNDRPHNPKRPLVVDLDGTLVATDTLWESVLKLASTQPLYLFLLPIWLKSGKANLKRQVGHRVEFDAEALPYRPEVLEFIREQRAHGRPIILATASDESVANAVSKHLGLFDKVLASDGKNNRRDHAKVQAIRDVIEADEFDYMGDSAADLPVWDASTNAIAVDPSPSVLSRLTAMRAPQRVFMPENKRSTPAAIMNAIRPQQWAKNVLLAVPLLAAHLVGDVDRWTQLIAAFIAFCLCASSVYVVNDLFDIEADRRHPRKCKRPFASGDLSVPQGLLLACCLLPASFLIAWFACPLGFVGMLAIYLALTCAYTFYFKRKVMVDVIILAGLYTQRIVAGGYAVGIELPTEMGGRETEIGFFLTPWLLAFSMFLFLSLAFAKRYAELMRLSHEDEKRAKGRGYCVTDLKIVGNAGTASGYIAAMVFVLYLKESTDVTTLYENPMTLWLIAPVFLYWISRVWVFTFRGEMNEDPVVFALTDRVSHLCAYLIILLLILSGSKPM